MSLASGNHRHPDVQVHSPLTGRLPRIATPACTPHPLPTSTALRARPQHGQLVCLPAGGWRHHRALAAGRPRSGRCNASRGCSSLRHDHATTGSCKQQAPRRHHGRVGQQGRGLFRNGGFRRFPAEALTGLTRQAEDGRSGLPQQQQQLLRVGSGLRSGSRREHPVDTHSTRGCLGGGGGGDQMQGSYQVRLGARKSQVCALQQRRSITLRHKMTACARCLATAALFFIAASTHTHLKYNANTASLLVYPNLLSACCSCVHSKKKAVRAQQQQRTERTPS